jgi:hypothetical protein
MRKLILIVIGILALLTLYTLEKSNVPKKIVYLKLVEEDFHDDFDSTYYVYGNRTDTFKLNHKCNGKYN